MNNRILVALVLGAAALVARAQTDTGRTSTGHEIRILKDSAAGRVVSTEYEGRFAYVRIEAREPGAAANQHPARIDPAQLRAALAAVQLSGRKPEQLLTDAQLDEISAPLAGALAKASAEQDVAFAASDRHGYLGPLAPRAVTTGRVFVRDEQLNVIFGLVRRDFESQFRATGVLMPFEPGQRAGAVDSQVRLALVPEAGASRRADWVALNLQARAAAPTPGSPAAAPPAPAAASAPTPAAPPAAAPSPPAGATPDAEAIFRSVSERLKALQKLRDSGLITEQEYQDKRRQLLKDM